MRTQVAIVGAGPAGLLLGHLLTRAGIDNVIIERASRTHVLSRIRAGVLEEGSVGLLRGVSRVESEGLVHTGIELAFAGQRHRIDLSAHTGKTVTVYGQTEVTRDLMADREHTGAPCYYEATDAEPSGFEGSQPRVSFRHGGREIVVAADFIAGCDGYHGVCRRSVPAGAISLFERSYSFGWLGLLADVPPCHDELVYAHHERGFALCSMRSPSRSRYYIQVADDAKVEAWSEAAFWDELRRRLPPSVGEAVVSGPALEMSIAVLRSFVAEPLRFGRLFLAGDAGHIVPPTGAKGLNLAISDVHYLFEGLSQHYGERSAAGLDAYSARALARVWKAQRFSTWMTRTLHRMDSEGPVGRRLQEAELDYLVSSAAAAKSLAENYVGLPY